MVRKVVSTVLDLSAFTSQHHSSLIVLYTTRREQSPEWRVLLIPYAAGGYFANKK